MRKWIDELSEWETDNKENAVELYWKKKMNLETWKIIIYCIYTHAHVSASIEMAFLRKIFPNRIILHSNKKKYFTSQHRRTHHAYNFIQKICIFIGNKRYWLNALTKNILPISDMKVVRSCTSPLFDTVQNQNKIKFSVLTSKFSQTKPNRMKRNKMNDKISGYKNRKREKKTKCVCVSVAWWKTFPKNSCRLCYFYFLVKMWRSIWTIFGFHFNGVFPVTLFSPSIAPAIFIFRIVYS